MKFLLKLRKQLIHYQKIYFFNKHMENIKQIMEEGLKKLEESGVIEVGNYHSVDFSITKPATYSFSGEQKPEIEVTVCGYEKGNKTFSSKMQNNGYGSTIEEAILDLSLRFAGRK